MTVTAEQQEERVLELADTIRREAVRLQQHIEELQRELERDADGD